MADAQTVVEVAIREAALLATTGGEWERDIKPLVLLARDALNSEDGTISDEAVRESGIHPSQLHKMGIG